jgi:hypothetical protein
VQYDKSANSSKWEMLINEPRHFLGVFQYQNTSWPIDRKWVIAGQKASGPLTLQFTVVDVLETDGEQPVMLCRQLPADHSDEEQRIQPEAVLDNVSIFLNNEVRSTMFHDKISVHSCCT